MLAAWHNHLGSHLRTASQRSKAQQDLIFQRRDLFAQILLYSGKNSSAALLATNPRARLYAELLEGRMNGDVRIHLKWSNDRLVSLLKPLASPSVSVALARSIWWLQRCGLPIRVDLGLLHGEVDLNAPNDLVIAAIVGGDKLSFLKAPSNTVPFLQELALSGAAFASLATTPSKFARLRVLRICDFSVAQATVLSALPYLEEVHINGTMGRFDVSQLNSAQHLRKLYISGSELLTIGGLLRCPQLEVISVHSSSWKNVACITEATNVRKIVIIEGAVSDLPTFNSFKALECVSLPWCKHLTSLSNLATCISLTKIVASGSGVNSVEGLNTCPLLEIVDFSNCDSLSDLSPLSGAPQLRKITASGSALQSVCGLDTCPFLSVLDVSWCYSLEDLSPLAGSPRLHTLIAACSGVINIAGLNSCNALEHVNFNHCDHLTSLSCLKGAPSLRWVYARGSGVCDVSGLETCKELEVLDLSRCKSLRTVPDSFLPPLKTLFPK
jgi:Leucine-rich repeat (LRR) protein